MSDQDSSAPNAPNAPPVVPTLARVAVIKRCGQCEHYQQERVNFTGPWRIFCDYPEKGKYGREMEAPNAPPPDWCPLEPATDTAALIEQMHAEDGCDGATLAECIQQLREQRLSAKYEMYGTQAHVAALRAALAPYADRDNWRDDTDGRLPIVEVGSKVAADALAATPEQSLAALRAEAAAEALERAAEFARTRRDEHYMRGEVSGAEASGAMYAHLTIEAIRLREAAQ